MKSSLIILFISILTISECCAQNYSEMSVQESQNKKKDRVDNSVLDFYRRYGSHTDPGEYEYLYKDLPDQVICLLQKYLLLPVLSGAQLISLLQMGWLWQEKDSEN